MTEPTPIPPSPLLPRGVRRILVEALVVGFMGALVYGTLWELQLSQAGLIVACIIWIAGAPILELLRLRNSK
jgi:hypothetical protein